MSSWIQLTGPSLITVIATVVPSATAGSFQFLFIHSSNSGDSINVSFTARTGNLYPCQITIYNNGTRYNYDMDFYLINVSVIF